MPQLPDQRGFYDDIRPFQRRDIRVRTEAFAPSRSEQFRTQLLAGLLVFLFLLGALCARLYQAKEELHTKPQPGSFWTGVSTQPPAGAASRPAQAAPRR